MFSPLQTTPGIIIFDMQSLNMMIMAQHFLLSAKSRKLSLKTIYQGGHEKAYETFCRMLRASDGVHTPDLLLIGI